MCSVSFKYENVICTNVKLAVNINLQKLNVKYVTEQVYDCSDGYGMISRVQTRVIKRNKIKPGTCLKCREKKVVTVTKKKC